MRQLRRLVGFSPYRMGLSSLIVGLLFLYSSWARDKGLSDIPQGGSVVRGTPADTTSFAELTEQYFLDRSVDYANELLLKEGYLTLLYRCTSEELKIRRTEGSGSTSFASPLWDLPAITFDRHVPEPELSSISQRFSLWHDYEEHEYQRRLSLILDVRSRLIAAGTPLQNERMFRRELKKAIAFYGQREWDFARLLFDRLLEDYPYQAQDDILYYQAQTCLQQQLLECALRYNTRLLSECPDSPYRASSYDQATAILQVFGEDREIRKLYGDYVAEGAPGDPRKMGGIYVRSARAEADLGHFDLAVDILEKVHPQSNYFLASRYLLADCLAALEDWPRAVQVLTAMVSLKQGDLPFDRWRMLMDEARIKLAIIYYEWNDYERATEILDQIKINSPFYDRVILSQGWIAYQLDDYAETIAKAEELLKLYPRSTEIYEARSLAGYCYEQMGDKNSAHQHFLEVLEAGVGRFQLGSFLEERRRLSETMADLQALESQVFSSGDGNLFSDYKRARNQIWICQQRLGLAELLQVNARMRDLIAERVELDSLVNAHRTLETQISRLGDNVLTAEFLQIEDRINLTLERLKTLGEEQLKANPLYYQEAQVGYINARADSLSARLEREITLLTTTITATREARQFALEHQDLKRAQEAGGRLSLLLETLDQSYLNLTYAEISRRPALRTRVERWSDFSFNRYAMGGMELEELDRKYDRLKKVEDYLNTLDDIIEQRQSQTPVEGAVTNPAPDTAQQP